MNTFRVEHSIETKASAQSVWQLWRDTASWPSWNPGVSRIEMQGDFAPGQSFLMYVDQAEPPLTSRLIDVRPNERFTDETRVGDLVVRVTHRIDPVTNGNRRITYALEAVGPDADKIGPTVSADFPEVLRALNEAAMK